MNPQRITLLDHYDSFSMNVVQLIKSATGCPVERLFCDDGPGMAAFMERPTPLVLSPGPRTPNDVPQSLNLVKRHLGEIPILGICLGHQILGQLHGGTIAGAYDPHHGTQTDMVIESSDPLFAFVPAVMKVACYHSLVITGEVEAKSIAYDAKSGDILALRFPYEQPTYGLQFHPESYLSEGGVKILKNWWELCCHTELDDFINKVGIRDASISR